MDLSIIIVSWNTKEFTLNCIDSIYRNTPDNDFEYEIILIDNASDDGTLEEVKKKFPRVRVHGNLENEGFARANNTGVYMSGGDAVLLLNSDTNIKDDSIFKVYSFLQKQNPDIGAVTCRLLNFDGSLQINCRQFYTIWNFMKRFMGRNCFFLPAAVRSNLNFDLWEHNKIRHIDWAPMSFFMLRRSVFEQAGPLDEQFFFYGEDLDYCWRLRQNKYRLLFLNTTEIFHRGAASAEQRYEYLTREYVNALFKFYKKYNMRISAIIVRIWWFFKKYFTGYSKESIEYFLF
jgi:hypothetical protein